MIKDNTVKRVDLLIGEVILEMYPNKRRDIVYQMKGIVPKTSHIRNVPFCLQFVRYDPI